MVKGGIFVSHHISDKMDNEMVLTMKIVELMTRAMGYPTHTLPLGTLKEALAKAGFADFIVREPDLKLPFPATLLAAKKTKDL